MVIIEQRDNFGAILASVARKVDVLITRSSQIWPVAVGCGLLMAAVFKADEAVCALIVFEVLK